MPAECLPTEHSAIGVGPSLTFLHSPSNVTGLVHTHNPFGVMACEYISCGVTEHDVSIENESVDSPYSAAR